MNQWLPYEPFLDPVLLSDIFFLVSSENRKPVVPFVLYVCPFLLNVSDTLIHDLFI